jgi:hypothetical protein
MQGNVSIDLAVRCIGLLHIWSAELTATVYGEQVGLVRMVAPSVDALCKQVEDHAENFCRMFTDDPASWRDLLPVKDVAEMIEYEETLSNPRN